MVSWKHSNLKCALAPKKSTINAGLAGSSPEQLVCTSSVISCMLSIPYYYNDGIREGGGGTVGGVMGEDKISHLG